MTKKKEYPLPHDHFRKNIPCSGPPKRLCGRQKPSIFLCSLPEEISFISIMNDTQNMYYDSNCAMLNADAERKKSFRSTADTNTPSSTIMPTPMPKARIADVTPPRASGKTTTASGLQTDMDC